MGQEEQKPERVEQLEHFPFSTFSEFQKAARSGTANIGIDRGVALQWSQKGIYASSWVETRALILAFLPFVAAIGFVAYAVATKSWLLLLALPIMLIAFFIFHPTAGLVFGSVRKGLIGLSFIGLVWGYFAGMGGLMAFCLALVVIWYAQRTIYRKAIDGLIRAVVEHEDLLCLVWAGKSLNIRLSNGNTYWTDWKEEDGKSVHYTDLK